MATCNVTMSDGNPCSRESKTSRSICILHQDDDKKGLDAFNNELYHVFSHPRENKLDFTKIVFPNNFKSFQHDFQKKQYFMIVVSMTDQILWVNNFSTVLISHMLSLKTV